MSESIDIYQLLDDYHISLRHLAPRKRNASLKFAAKFLKPFIGQSYTDRRPSGTKTPPTAVQFRLGKLTGPIGLPSLVINPDMRNGSAGELDLFHPYYLLNLAYLANHTPLAKSLYQRAYRALCNLLNDRPITIYNAGPGLINSLLSYYCHHHPGSRFYLIQHAVYQLCHRPYYYQTQFSSTVSWVWSELQADIHRAQGVEHTEVLPNLKIATVADRATIDWSQDTEVVIIGESSDKYYANYNSCFQQVVKEAMVVLAQQKQIGISQIYFKPHPRTPAKEEWKEVCQTEGWTYTEQMPETKNLVVVGAFSTYLIEVMATGVVGFQIQSARLRQLVDYDDYTRYTALIPLGVQNVTNEVAGDNQIDASYFERAQHPFIDATYLCVDPRWADRYRDRIHAEVGAKQ